MNNAYSISIISNGHYEVTIDLDAWLSRKQILAFREKINGIRKEDCWFDSICTLDNSVLKYRSESLFPEKDNYNKKKVMLVFGNPATHSVANGMFFYSQSNGRRHRMWGHLDEAKLMKNFKCETRKEEAQKRKKSIIAGNTSSKYLLGLTTFYSFPTPVKGPYKNVTGVKTLFKNMLDTIKDEEYKRLSNYPFSKDALWIFTEKSSYIDAEKMHRNSGTTIAYWQYMGKDHGGGKELADIIRKH